MMIGELRVWAQHSILGDAVERRVQWREAIASVGIDGFSTTIERALCQAHGVPLAGLRNMGAESAALRRYDEISSRSQTSLEEAVGARAADFGHDFLRFAREVLVHGGDVGRGPEGRLLLHGYFRGLTGGKSMISISSALRKSKAFRASYEEFDLRFLGALELEASLAFSQIAELRRVCRRWKELAADSREDSRIGQAAALLIAGMMLPPAGLGELMKLDPAAARRHLKRLEAAGVAQEVTGRKGWRVYMAADLDAQDDAPSSARSTPRLSTQATQGSKAPLDMEEFDALMQGALDEADAAIRRIERRWKG